MGLAAAGADIVINYVSHPEAAEDVAHEIEAMGRRALPIKADVSQEDQVEAMFAKAIKQFGTLHSPSPTPACSAMRLCTT